MNGLNIVDANPVTAMFDIRIQKCRPLGMREAYFRIMERNRSANHCTMILKQGGESTVQALKHDLSNSGTRVRSSDLKRE